VSLSRKSGAGAVALPAAAAAAARSGQVMTLA